jgi:hypothetical protein
MRRFSPLGVLVLALLAGPPIHAQDFPKITDVRVGWARGDEDYYKVGTWVPVTVDIEVLDQDFKGDDRGRSGGLIIEATDGDGVWSEYVGPAEPIFVSRAEKTRSFVSYIKPGNGYGEIRITIEGTYGTKSVRRTFSYPDSRVPYRPGTPIPHQSQLIVGIGLPKGLEPSQLDTTQSLETQRLTDRGFRVAFQTDVNKLPEHWFGYDSVDVVILPTGGNWSGSVAQQLANDEKRRTALAQWVEMGGHLVVSVSSNANSVSNPRFFPLAKLFPADVDPEGSVKVDKLQGVRGQVDRLPSGRRTVRGGQIKSFGADLARLKPKPMSEAWSFEEGPNFPSVVRGPYGLGKVTLIAFDTDTGAFGFWENNKDFWVALLELKTEIDPNARMRMNQFGGYMESNDLANQLCNQLDVFGEVKVIPFWWVAVFILIYIFVVGPLDYLVLKKVMKRLTGQERMEWTWLTFPTVVLIVSVGAYYLAHYLKGDELRINKVDLVDIDMQNGQAYGNTWFTVFSPRLQHYNLAVEPTGINSVPEIVNISWMGRPGEGARNLGRRSSPGLFQRTYQFRNGAQDLEGVPIHVWSMKTFTGRWGAPIAKEQPPPIKHDIKVQQKLLSGSFTWQMPYALHNCQILYRERIWEVGEVAPNTPIRLTGNYRDISTLELGGPGPGWRSTQFADTVRRMMFSSVLSRSASESNDYVHEVDQGWRLQYPEAILIGTLAEGNGPAADVDKADRLGSKFKTFEPRLRGTMKQVTVVRVFIPLDESQKN